MFENYKSAQIIFIGSFANAEKRTSREDMAELWVGCAVCNVVL